MHRHQPQSIALDGWELMGFAGALDDVEQFSFVAQQRMRCRVGVKCDGVHTLTSRKPRVLIFIVAYNAERTIQQVLRRVPIELSGYDTEILVIDDSSSDATVEQARALERESHLPFPLTVLFNPVNLGYGGNQKVGFLYAIRNEFDFVALVHGDGQYAPERLPDLLEPLIKGEADAVFGSRMIGKWDALRGGMPAYKFIGNRILTGIQNRLLGSSLSEFHSGYRLYSVKALASVPFQLNANEFHFDTDIIIQFMRAGLRIKELPIPTYYGDEVCYVNGFRYAWDVCAASLVAYTQDLGIFYERKFDVRQSHARYESKLAFDSSHTLVVDRVPPDTRVLDLGCASGVVSSALLTKNCRITAMDVTPLPGQPRFERFIRHNLNDLPLPIDTADFDYILLLDVIEHLQSPETFVAELRRLRTEGRATRVIVTTGNIGFLVTRLMLLLGAFNYGARGILDLTHSRLFTFTTLRRLFEQAGYRIDEIRGIPAPFPLAVGNKILGRLLLKLNRLLIHLSKGLFSYQILMVVAPLPSSEWLLSQAIQTHGSVNVPVQQGD
ncbi:MAG TPA: bifunctional glycosyltransferase/class I SAM-dependent methyltransferase [Terriglobia bacterium]